MTKAVGVLKPVEMSLNDVATDPPVRKEIESRPALLLGKANVAQLRDHIEDLSRPENRELVSDEERTKWAAGVTALLEQATFIKVRRRFTSALWWMFGAALVGATAIIVLAWAANPPDPSPSETPVVSPAPVLVSITLTDDGREAFETVLGKRCVERRRIRALSIGGEEGAPQVVTLPEFGCKAAQFGLSPELGAATGPLAPAG